MEDITINVTASQLHAAAGSFSQASSETEGLLRNLDSTAQQLVGELYSEFRSSPAALQNLCDRWRNSTTSLVNVLQQLAQNLEKSATLYVQNDSNAMPGQ